MRIISKTYEDAIRQIVFIAQQVIAVSRAGIDEIAMISVVADGKRKGWNPDHMKLIK